MMNISPIENEEKNAEDGNDIHIPFDGFVDVNELIRKRRSKRQLEVDLNTILLKIDLENSLKK